MKRMTRAQIDSALQKGHQAWQVAAEMACFPLITAAIAESPSVKDGLAGTVIFSSRTALCVFLVYILSLAREPVTGVALDLAFEDPASAPIRGPWPEH